jgi:hypothetical protein
MTSTNNSNDDDAQKLHQERIQKLNIVMDHLGFHASGNNNSNQQQQLDSSSLLAAKDVEALRKNYLHLQSHSNLSTQPDDSYIFAALRWIYSSVKASVESGYQYQQEKLAKQREHQKLLEAQKKAEEEHQRLLAERRREEQIAELERQKALNIKKKETDDFRASSEGRTLKLTLSDEDAKDLHPKVATIRSEVLDIENKLHDTLDRVMKARLRFLTLAKDDPPCMPEMKMVADCYAQFAAKKYETAVHLEKEAVTPDIVKKHQQQIRQQQSSNKAALKFTPRTHPDLPEDLLATEQVLKLSTSVLACRELCKQLDKCTLSAGQAHIAKNHGEQQ